jgi:hypothetical protein
MAAERPRFWRNCGLIIPLIVPGLLVQVAGEYVLQKELPLARNLSFADYTRVMGDMLGSFLWLSVCPPRDHCLADSRSGRCKKNCLRGGSTRAPSLGCSAPDEEPQE